MKEKINKQLWINFVLYLIILEWLLLVHCGFLANSVVKRYALGRVFEWIPFQASLDPFIKKSLWGSFVEVVSIISGPFYAVPITLVVLHLLREEKKKKRLWITISSMFLLFLMTELIQWFTYLGALQISDVILYSIGIVITCLIYEKMKYKLSDERMTKTLRITGIIMASLMVIVVVTTVVFGFRIQYYLDLYKETGEIVKNKIF